MSKTVLVTLILLALAAPLTTATQLRQPVVSGKRYPRLVIRNAMVIDGNGTPASGPYDIVIEGNTIADSSRSIRSRSEAASRGGPPADAEIDATGKYVLPGLINAHGHVQDERGGIPQPLDYELKLWLASGITTVRDVGSDTQKTLALREASAAGDVAAPRIVRLRRRSMTGAGAARRGRRRGRGCASSRRMGADGIKTRRHRPRHHGRAGGRSRKAGLPHRPPRRRRRDQCLGRHQVRHHEHRALVRHPRRGDRRRRQDFPSSYNYNNEVDRFR